MGIFGRLGILALGLLLIPPSIFVVAGLTAAERIRVEKDTLVQAPPDRVWGIVTDWQVLTRGMGKLMPGVGKRQVLGGSEPRPGVVLRYPLSDNRNWDQRVVDWQPGRAFVFRNEKGAAAGMPGDVTMGFYLEPQGQATRVRYLTEVRPQGFLNRAFAQVFGVWLGTLEGYESTVLETVKTTAEGKAPS